MAHEWHLGCPVAGVATDLAGDEATVIEHQPRTGDHGGVSVAGRRPRPGLVCCDPPELRERRTPVGLGGHHKGKRVVGVAARATSGAARPAQRNGGGTAQPRARVSLAPSPSLAGQSYGFRGSIWSSPACHLEHAAAVVAALHFTRRIEGSSTAATTDSTAGGGRRREPPGKPVTLNRRSPKRRHFGPDPGLGV